MGKSTRTRNKELLEQALTSLNKSLDLYGQSLEVYFERYPRKLVAFQSVAGMLQSVSELMELSHADI